MISVAEARSLIAANISALSPVMVPIQKAAGLVLAEDVYAITDIPAFPQSSMDGYAFNYAGWQMHQALQIKGVIPAGRQLPGEIAWNEAVRIFTGAPVPAGADTVIMQEKVTVEGQVLGLNDPALQPGTNVRPAGSELKKGDLVLPAETCLMPAATGFLAGAGIADVLVFRNPVISIIVTGNELQKPGRLLEYGQVYESNSFTLTSALQQLGITGVKVIWADDHLDVLINILKSTLEQSDMVLLTGGVSVGDYDFVLEAAAASDVKTVFHKIKQRPGKPLFFGKKGEKPIFGLPGNPSSVLTCFYEYVIPALDLLCRQRKRVRTVFARLEADFKKSTGLTHFLRGIYNGNSVRILDGQESYRLSSFARANCLVQASELPTDFRAGEEMEVHLLPN